MTTKHSHPKLTVRRPATTLLLVAAAVALFALTLAGPSLAKKPADAKQKTRPFVCRADVTSVNTSANTLTAKVVRGSRQLKGSVGKQVTFSLAGQCVILKVGSDGADVISLGSVAAGDRVVINGLVDRNDANAPVFTAWFILDRGPAPLK